MDKQRVFILFLIAIVSASITLGGAWGINTLTKDLQGKKLNSLSVKQEAIKEKVNKIETENKYRDEYINDFVRFKEKDAEWKILDAEWKGAMSKALNQSMYYGDSGKLGDLIRISDENKKNVSKKKYE